MAVLTDAIDQVPSNYSRTARARIWGRQTGKLPVAMGMLVLAVGVLLTAAACADDDGNGTAASTTVTPATTTKAASLPEIQDIERPVPSTSTPLGTPTG